MSDPDSIVEYVRWLDKRHNRLREAVQSHRANKQSLSLPGTVDRFDEDLWAKLDASYEDDE